MPVDVGTMGDGVLVRLGAFDVGADVAVAVAVANAGDQITGASLTVTPRGLATAAGTPAAAATLHCAELASSAACKSEVVATAGAPAPCAGAVGTCH